MPLLPAAVTTAMPLRDSRSTACTSGSVKIDSSTRVTERDVDDLDLVGLVIARDPLERVDHVAGVARAVVAEHAQRDDVDVRRDAGIDAVRMRAAARDDAGDVRAVAAVVDRRAAAADEILVGANAAQRQIRVRRDPRVDDRDRRCRCGTR